MANVLVGVCGGVAAYKAAYLVRELARRGHESRVILTRNATRFVGPITFTGLTGAPPVTDLWDPSYAGEVHVELAGWADAMVIAPATAHLLSRAVSGEASDALTATLLCFDGPKLFAPAMHHRMWNHPATRRNAKQLLADGARFAGPVDGPLASGESGVGRMEEPEAIADALEAMLASESDLAGQTFLVTAGGTREDLDPVRFLGNRSTGKMGYAVAEAAAARGARVILVSAPTALPTPEGVERISVVSAREMQAAVNSRRDEASVIVMAAAVADYRPKVVAAGKMAKGEGPLMLELVRNPDILAGLGAWRRDNEGEDGPVLVGFAVQTEDLAKRARAKLEAKGADLIVANLAAASFGRDDNEVVLVDAESERALPPMSKREVARAILDDVVRRLSGR